MECALNKVAGFRAMLGLTQKDVADYLGITPQNYSFKERGHRRFNDDEKKKMLTLLRQAEKDLTIDELFF